MNSRHDDDDTQPSKRGELSETARRHIDRLGATQSNFPSPTDVEGWRQFAALGSARIFESHLAGVSEQANVQSDIYADVPIARALPKNGARLQGKTVLDIHGGALVFMGGPFVEAMACQTAAKTGLETISVDYRMPPDHPYPAGLDDCCTVYRKLIEDIGPSNLTVVSASAGGNLAAAMLLRMRDEGRAMPSSLVLISPEIDLTESGDSFKTLAGVAGMGSLMPINELYAAGHPLDHPHVSPLFGNLHGFPPTLLQSGTRDLFLSNTVRMHRALLDAGCSAELHIWDAMPHGGFIGAPEDQQVDMQIRRFIDNNFSEVGS